MSLNFVSNSDSNLPGEFLQYKKKQKNMQVVLKMKNFLHSAK